MMIDGTEYKKGSLIKQNSAKISLLLDQERLWSHGWLWVAKIGPIYSFESKNDNDGNVSVVKKSFEGLLTMTGKFLDVLYCLLHCFYCLADYLINLLLILNITISYSDFVFLDFYFFCKNSQSMSCLSSIYSDPISLTKY